MADTLRIKRRSSAGAAGAPASLAAAEIAYNEKDETLYYGWGDSGGTATVVKPIAGPGAFVSKAGDTMTGALVLPAAPTLDLQASTKKYVDDAAAILQAADATKAPLASPALTGTPTAPTVAPGTESSTKIATTAFVQSAVSAAGGAAPSNTNPIMDSVAAPGSSALYARGDHVHPSDTAKVSLAGDTMTGELAISKTNARFVLNTPDSTSMESVFRQNAVPRWNSFVTAGPTADYYVGRYNDAGTFLDAPIYINRSDGRISILGDPTAALHVATKQYVDKYAAPLDALAYNGMQINGSMEVAQQGVGGTGTTGTYALDGWKLAHTLTVNWTGAAQAASSLFPGLPNCMFANVGTAKSSLAGTDYACVYQPIEGYRVSRLAWGTASAKPLTIGFWSAHHRTGLYSVVFTNGGATRSCVTSYTQAAADVAQYNVITIPGDTTGTWETTSNIGLYIYFTYACGTSYTTSTLNTWQAGGSLLAATGQVNGVAATSDFMRWTGVVVLPGSQSPTAAQSPLIMRPYDQELSICQRYYYRRDFSANQWIAVLQAYTTAAASGKLYDFPCRMRAAPTYNATGGYTIFNSAGSGFAISGGTVTSTQDFAYLGGVGAPGITLRAGDAVLFSCNTASAAFYSAQL